VASLKLMGRLDDIKRKDELVRWCILRQLTGFQGRVNKVPDTCYSWWIGATLVMFEKFDMLRHYNLRSFIYDCQSDVGGFSKWRDTYPDVLHSYFSLAGLSFLGEAGLKEIDPGLGIAKESAKRVVK